MPLKKADVNRATCPPDKKSVLLSDGDGLLLRITSPNNLKGWVYRYTFNGKRTMTTIGSLDEMDIEEAREEKNALKKLVRSGQNPALVRKEIINQKVAATKNTFKHLYEKASYERMNNPRKKWSEEHIRRNQYTWAHLQSIKDIPITDMPRSKLREFLVKIALKSPATAQKCKSLLSMCYTYAVAHDIVPKNLISTFADDPILRKPTSDEVDKRKNIEVENLGHAFNVINEYEGLVLRNFMFINAYTSLRIKSQRFWQWSDIKDDHITIPKQYVKNRKAIKCPLVPKIKELLDEIKEYQQAKNPEWTKSCYVFSDNGGTTPIAADTPQSKLRDVILPRAKLPLAHMHGNRTNCEDLWEIEGFTESAINIQQDHASQTGNTTRDRYKSKSKDFFDERYKMVQFMVDFIEEKMIDARR